MRVISCSGMFSLSVFLRSPLINSIDLALTKPNPLATASSRKSSIVIYRVNKNILFQGNNEK
jgi:hypothetical protein